jgi:hypothetical protein
MGIILFWCIYLMMKYPACHVLLLDQRNIKWPLLFDPAPDVGETSWFCNTNDSSKYNRPMYSTSIVHLVSC